MTSAEIPYGTYISRVKRCPHGVEKLPPKRLMYTSKNTTGSKHTSSNRLHNIKAAAALKPNDDVIISHTGDIFSAKTKEFIGSITDDSFN